MQTGKNIVPITINGSGKVLPSGDWRLRPGTIEVIVEKPIMPSGHRIGNLRLLSDQVRQAIAAHLRPVGNFAARDGEPMLTPSVSPALEKHQL